MFFLCAEGVTYSQLATNYGVDRNIISDICCKQYVLQKNRDKYQWAMISALCRQRFKLNPQSQAYAQCTDVLIEVCNLCAGLPYDASVWDMVEDKWKAKKASKMAK